jgi:peptidoglycan/xylan/chitin deacetylase (PgdA/CDA1 family)
VVITFDDGFKNNLWAAEVLKELDLPATFFVLSGVIGTQFKPWYIQFGELITHRTREAWQCSWGAVDFRQNLNRRQWLKRTKEHLLALRPPARAEALQEIAEQSGSIICQQIDPDLEFMNAGDLRRLAELGMTLGGHSKSHDNLAACSKEELQTEILDSSDELEALSGAKIRFFSYPDGRFNPMVLELARARFEAAFSTEVGYTARDLWQFPRRAADGADLASVLSRYYPARRVLIDRIKRAIRC